MQRRMHHNFSYKTHKKFKILKNNRLNEEKIAKTEQKNSYIVILP